MHEHAQEIKQHFAQNRGGIKKRTKPMRLKRFQE